MRFAACHSAANPSHAGRADKVCRQLGRVHQLPTRSQNLFALTIGTRNVRGEGSLRGLFEKVIFPLGVASPTTSRGDGIPMAHGTTARVCPRRVNAHAIGAAA